ncbi:hypothetical protein [Ruegeria sp. HKCCD8929]|uniref:hypothetical protein n=1 Tax=Ruegeria sp. HKCCD8929 TaxID=2683006 RepID=UPI00148770C5|nr:hypothetical protein [Ruegeria sp. HKCCD8929]
MTRTADVRNWKRNLTTDRFTKETKSLEESVTEGLPDAQSIEIETFNPFTGTPSRIKSFSGPTASNKPEALISAALQHVKASAQALGFNSGSADAEFVPDPAIVTTSSGANVV